MFISKRCHCLSKIGQCCKRGKDTENLSKDLSIMSVKTRLDILFHLKDKPHCVCDLENHTDLSQSLISHHLSDLANAGFIESKREGKFMDYFLTDKGKKFLKAVLLMLN
jgi:DNA-binding transcriptional ArsR family regulator